MAGIVGDLWYLFKDCLSVRLQCVAVDGELSGFLPVRSDVPQGSILGPLLFLSYLLLANNLPLAVPTLRVFMFGDNTKPIANG